MDQEKKNEKLATLVMDILYVHFHCGCIDEKEDITVSQSFISDAFLYYILGKNSLIICDEDRLDTFFEYKKAAINDNSVVFKLRRPLRSISKSVGSILSIIRSENKKPTENKFIFTSSYSSDLTFKLYTEIAGQIDGEIYRCFPKPSLTGKSLDREFFSMRISKTLCGKNKTFPVFASSQKILRYLRTLPNHTLKKFVIKKVNSVGGEGVSICCKDSLPLNNQDRIIIEKKIISSTSPSVHYLCHPKIDKLSRSGESFFLNQRIIVEQILDNKFKFIGFRNIERTKKNKLIIKSILEIEEKILIERLRYGIYGPVGTDYIIRKNRTCDTPVFIETNNRCTFTFGTFAFLNLILTPESVRKLISGDIILSSFLLKASSEIFTQNNIPYLSYVQVKKVKQLDIPKAPADILIIQLYQSITDNIDHVVLIGGTFEQHDKILTL
ncbi:MAG: ATP-grasp domain-containing protein [Methylocystaceae bacterium]|nr:ATP-grasp domain-containing protein [Methylocystaceae bacterium]